MKTQVREKVALGSVYLRIYFKVMCQSAILNIPKSQKMVAIGLEAVQLKGVISSLCVRPRDSIQTG
jgi:hypothetical protein